MIERRVEARARRLAVEHPIVLVTGPRQSGKTTLCQRVWPAKPYVNLENPDDRRFARTDPRAFLARYEDGAILDEIQNAPELPSYLQALVDERGDGVSFVLTGSQNFRIRERVTQSLAGRAALVELLPCEWSELREFDDPPERLFEVLFTGSYPRIHDRHLRPSEWLSAYIGNYVERDVRHLLNIGDLTSFQTFLGLCAGRSSQLLNLSGLGADCGISHNTAKAWLSVLEASYILFRLTPYFSNHDKRLVKAPKLFFYDTGVLCYLLGIKEPEQLARHPLRGAVFETWVVAEVMKSRQHLGDVRGLHFYRNRKGLEVDLLIVDADRVRLVEVKSGQTIAADFFDNLRAVDSRIANEGKPRESFLVYGGNDAQDRSDARVLPWSSIDELRS